MGVNLALFVAMSALAINSGAHKDTIMNGPGFQVLLEFGAKWAPLINHHGQVWRLVTADFLHIGILHILFNSFALFQIAPLVEETYGSQKFIFIYLVTGVGGFLLSYILAPGSESAGASSSLFGLIGIIAVFGYRMGGTAGNALMKQMLIWAGINVLFGFMVGADNFAHLGGMGSGAAIGFMVTPSHPETQRAANLWNGLAIACALIIMASFACMALNFGTSQNLIDLDSAVRKTSEAFDGALMWKPGQDASKLSNDLRNSASDLDKVPQIDSRSDDIKRQFVILARKQADALDAAAKNPAGPTVGTLDADAMRGWQQALERYRQWVPGIAGDYGLKYEQETKPGPAKSTGP